MQLLFPCRRVKLRRAWRMSLAGLVRRADPDRYFCTLFAPPARREALFTLYALNHELARACEVTREPGLALIRLQWWREVIEGADRPHEVAVPLRASIRAGELDVPGLLALIEAREQEAEGGFETREAWLEWLESGAGRLMVAAGVMLGAPEAAWPRLRALGAGCGIAGQLRNLRAFAAQGRCLLPAEILRQADMTVENVVANPATAVTRLKPILAEMGESLLGAPLSFPREWIAAALPAVWARRDLKIPADGPRGAPDRLRVALAYLQSRS